MNPLSKSISERAVSVWSLITAMEGLLVVYLLAREPSETESVFSFGLSLQLLFVVIGIFFVALFFLSISIAHFYKLISWNEFLNTNPKLVRRISSGAFILEIILLQIWLLFPDYYFPTFSRYLTRLSPVLIWFVLFFAQIFIFLTYFRGLTFECLKDSCSCNSYDNLGRNCSDKNWHYPR